MDQVHIAVLLQYSCILDPVITVSNNEINMTAPLVADIYINRKGGEPGVFTYHILETSGYQQYVFGNFGCEKLTLKPHAE